MTTVTTPPAAAIRLADLARVASVGIDLRG